MRNLIENILVRRLPQLTEPITSNLLLVFQKHLRKLRFRGFDVSDSSPPITLPSLVSLEVIADSPDHLLVVKYIQVPQLRVLRVQIEDGLGTLHQHDLGHSTNNQLDHISLRIEIPRDNKAIISLFFICLRPSLSMFLHHIHHCTYISPNQCHYYIHSMPALAPCQAHQLARLEHYQQCRMRNG